MVGLMAITGMHVFSFHTEHIQAHIKSRKDGLGLCSIGLIRAEFMIMITDEVQK